MVEAFSPIIFLLICLPVPTCPTALIPAGILVGSITPPLSYTACGDITDFLLSGNNFFSNSFFLSSLIAPVLLSAAFVAPSLLFNHSSLLLPLVI